MKKLISYTLIALCATIAISFAASDNNKDAIISKEKAAWQAFKDKKQDDFKKLVSADLVAVYSNGILTLRKELEALAKTEMQSFELSDRNVGFPDPGTALISCRAQVQ